MTIDAHGTVAEGFEGVPSPPRSWPTTGSPLPERAAAPGSVRGIAFNAHGPQPADLVAPGGPDLVTGSEDRFTRRFEHLPKGIAYACARRRFGFPSGVGAALENGRLAQSVLRAGASRDTVLADEREGR